MATLTTEPDRQTLDERLAQARRDARLTEAAWRLKRAEVARLVAAGERAAAVRLVRSVEGASPPEPHPPSAKANAPSPPSPTSSPTSQHPTAATPEETNAAPSGVDVRKSTAKRVAKQKPGPRRRSRPPGRDREAPKSSAAARAAKKPVLREAIRRRNRLKQGRLAAVHDWFSRRPPWVVSTAAHVAMLLVLALLSFAAWSDQPLVIDAAFASDAESLDAMPAEFAVLELETPAVESQPEVQVELASLATPTITAAPLELASATPLGDLLTADVSGLLQEVGGAAESESEGGDGAPEEEAAESGGGVRFFGADAVADRVAFVVDNSGSMQRGRMETTLMELDNAVRRLSHSQSFYVVFFSDQAYPMFFPEPVDELLPATRQNKQRVSKWLGTVQMCLGGRLLDAVEMAAAVEPQVVYLLTDGDIRSQYVVSRLTDGDAWDFTIHTLAMGVRTPADAGKLQAIAAANNGTFRMVRAHPAAIRRSLTNPVPYNRVTGKVWGTMVRRWEDAAR